MNKNTSLVANKNEQNTSFSEGLIPKLTNSELEVLAVIKEGIIDTAKIASRRQTGRRNIQKIISSLKKKGAFSITSLVANKNEGYSEQNELSGEQSGIRLHAEQFTITPISKSEKYTNAIGKKITIDNNTILVHNDVVQYYCNKSFLGADTWAATAKAMEYHDRVIRTIEHDLNIVLIKPRSQNIERVKSEYAHIRNGLAVKMEREGERIKIKTTESGKVWFEIDNSWKLHEAETKGKTAHRDMQRVIEPFFNDMRDKDNFLPSDVKKMIEGLVLTSGNMVQYSMKANENVAWLAENIKSHGPAWIGMKKEASNIRKEIHKLSGILAQKDLKRWL